MAEEALPLEGDEGAIDAPVEDVEAVEVEATEEAPEPTVADVASQMGWRPQEEWRGDPDKWKPAHEFVQSTAEINGKLNNRLKGMEDQISNMARTSAAMTERAVANERQRLLNERTRAFEDGDGEKFNKVDQQLTDLQAQPIAQQITPPETQAFLERNPWMNTDQEAAAWAQARAGELSNQGLGPARQLAIVEREAKGLFPEHFAEPKPAPKGVPLTKPGNRGPSKPAAKNFASLPPEAKKEALYYEKKGVPREDYAATYYETQEA